MNSPIPLTGNGFWASLSCLCFSFSVSLGKPNSILVKLLLCQSTPLYSGGGVPIYFWCVSLNICCLFLQCEQAVFPRMFSVFREKEGMGRASRQCLVAQFSTAAGTCREWHRLLLVAGPWEVVMSSSQICKVSRTFGSSSSRVCEFPGDWEQQQLVFISMPSSEVIGTSCGTCSGTPCGSGPCPSLESVITAVVWGQCIFVIDFGHIYSFGESPVFIFFHSINIFELSLSTRCCNTYRCVLQVFFLKFAV